MWEKHISKKRSTMIVYIPLCYLNLYLKEMLVFFPFSITITSDYMLLKIFSYGSNYTSILFFKYIWKKSKAIVRNGKVANIILAPNLSLKSISQWWESIVFFLIWLEAEQSSTVIVFQNINQSARKQGRMSKGPLQCLCI